MVRLRRPSAQTVLVLTALIDDPTAWRYGYELGRQVGLKAGSLYPILIRLRDRCLLEASWEDDPSPGRPPRHLYRLTGDGVRWAPRCWPGPHRAGRPAVPVCGRRDAARRPRLAGPAALRRRARPARRPPGVGFGDAGRAGRGPRPGGPVGFRLGVRQRRSRPV